MRRCSLSYKTITICTSHLYLWGWAIRSITLWLQLYKVILKQSSTYFFTRAGVPQAHKWSNPKSKQVYCPKTLKVWRTWGKLCSKSLKSWEQSVDDYPRTFIHYNSIKGMSTAFQRSYKVRTKLLNSPFIKSSPRTGLRSHVYLARTTKPQRRQPYFLADSMLISTDIT